MSKSDRERWCWTDLEFRSGSASSEAEAVRQATEDRHFAPGDMLLVSRLRDPKPPEQFFSAEDWIGYVRDQDDYLGDQAVNWCDATAEQLAELDDLVRPILRAWFERHSFMPTFRVDDDETVYVADERGTLMREDGSETPAGDLAMDS